VNDFDGDLIRRSLATAGEEADEKGAAQRKSRFEASIAKMETDPAERDRIDSIAAAAGIPDRVGNAGPSTAYRMAAGGITRILKHRPGRRHQPPKLQRRATRVGDFLAWLGGGDTALLAKIPGERTRFGQMAGVLLTTAGIAAISMAFALYDTVNAALWVAAIFSLLWGLIILNLDRFLVISMRRTRSRWRLIGIALPRIALATVLAVVISAPLVLRIFASDINSELATLHQERSQQFAALIESGPQAQEASQLRIQIDKYQAILADDVSDTATSTQLQNAQTQVKNLEAQAQTDSKAMDSARKAWQCELNGITCNGDSSVAGNGPRAHEDEQVYETAAAAYSETQSQLAAAQEAEAKILATLQAQARQNLDPLQSEYQAVENNLQKTTSDAINAAYADNGILIQLQALSEASAKDPTLEAARLLVFALFLLIEILPTTVRFLLNLGPETPYDILERSEEDQLIRMVQIHHVTQRSIEEIESRTRIEMLKVKHLDHMTQMHRDVQRSIEEMRLQTKVGADEDMQEREIDIGAKASAEAMSEMVKTLDKTLQELRQQINFHSQSPTDL
jgi:chromate transport protein ChrA